MDQTSGRRTRLLVTLGAAIAVLAAAAILAFSLASGSEQPAKPTVSQMASGESAGLLSAGPAADASISPGDVAGPTVAGTAAAAPFSAARGDRLRIPKLGVDAALAVKVVGRDGQMPNPDTPDEVAWYDFSGWPGLGGVPGVSGNSVFSGHVDSGRLPCKNGAVPPPCRAIFWDLRKLEQGDEVVVQVGGQSLRYVVEWNRVMNAAAAPWDEIVAATAQQSLTLITCSGNFDSASRQYDMRQVVWAKRAG
jgi:LPXTG-site transpeptidase (sortase) family protein